MIPVTDDDLLDDIEFEDIPTDTFRLDIERDIISGSVKDIEAMTQAIYLILNIERYEYLIYSWDYGIELQDLIGQPPSFTIPEMKRRITEALLADDRIISVDGFKIEQSKDKISVRFTVTTIFGEIETEKEVSV